MNKKLSIVLIIWTAIAVISLAWALGIHTPGINGSSSQNVERGSIPHSTVRINSDAEFSSSDAVISGTGTAGDPYIISGWEIDAHGEDAAIYIGNTSSYVLIKDCHVFNATNSAGYARGSGIALYSSNHILVENVTSEGNPNGIWISTYSSSINISNSMLVDNGIGISLHFRASHLEIFNNRIDGKFTGIRMDYGVNNITAEKNRIYNVTDYGIEMLGSLERISNITLERNTIRWTGYGIYMLSENAYHRIIGNIISNSSNDGIYAKDNVHDNTIENNTILYPENCGINVDNSDSSDKGFNRNVIANNDIAQTTSHGILINGRFGGASHNRISGNRINNSGASGIYLYDATDNRIDNNTLEYSREYGLRIYGYSDSNIIDGNIIIHTRFYAIYLLSSDGNEIYNNSFYYNNGTGDVYDPSNSQAYDSSGNNQWDHGGRGNYWHDLAGSYTDGDDDGILDGVSYPIAGGKGAADNYPLANPGGDIPELHMIILLLALTAITIISIMNKRIH